METVGIRIHRQPSPWKIGKLFLKIIVYYIEFNNNMRLHRKLYILLLHTYRAKNLIAKNGKVATLKIRSDEHNEIIKGVNVCSLVFLWYMTAVITSKLNINPTMASSIANDPPKFASKLLYKKNFSVVKLLWLSQSVSLLFIRDAILGNGIRAVVLMFVVIIILRCSTLLMFEMFDKTKAKTDYRLVCYVYALNLH